MNGSKKLFARRLLSIVLLSLLSKLTIAERGLDAGALQQYIEKEDPGSRVLPLPDAIKPKIKEPEVESTVRVTVKGVRFVGIKIDNEPELQAAVKHFIGQSYSLQALQALPDAVSLFYRKQGRVVQCTLPPQTIQEDGVITISILQAKLGAVTIENPKGRARISDERAANYITHQVKIGQPLDSEGITQGVVLLNQLPGIRAQSALEAGKNDGDTNVNIAIEKTKLLQGRLDMTNYGAQSTGQEQGLANFNLNGPLKIGDQATMFGAYSAGAQFTQLGYSLPIGYSGLRLAFSGNYMNYENINEYSVNGGSGYAWIAGTNLSYPIILKQGTSLNVMTGYDHKSYSNSNLATETINSEYTINNGVLGISANHYDGFMTGGETSFASHLIVGRFDISSTSPGSYQAYSDGHNGYTRYVPNNFQKITANLHRSQTLPFVRDTQLKINISGQWAAQNLNSAEQFYLGGPYGVRAYPVAQGYGSQGALGTLELQKFFRNGLIANAFIDSGVVKQYVDTYSNWQGLTGAGNAYVLSGAGFGLKWLYQHLEISAIAAWTIGDNPLLTQTGLEQNNDGSTGSPRGWFNAGYGF